MSDSGLFLSSQLKRFLERAAKSFPPPEPLGRHGIVNYHILCDGGFAQILHMQRPYTQTEWESQMRGYGLMGALIPRDVLSRTRLVSSRPDYESSTDHYMAS